MCSVCGCGEPGVSGTQTSHGHHHHHAHDHTYHHYGEGEAGLSVSGFSQSRLVEIEQNILSRNDQDAALNRSRLATLDTVALNLMSSPGAGKTTLLVETVKELKSRRPVAVIEGDQQTRNDARRIEDCGVRAVQINTGRGCHLDAHMVGHALDDLAPEPGGVVFVENVGNLVCPAAFDLGEYAKVVILSVTEGDDKPLKYPDMFAASGLMILSKVDLLEYLDFDAQAAIRRARRINPELEVISVSAKSGEGMAQWLEWIEARSDDEPRVASSSGVPDVAAPGAVHA